MYLPVLSVTKWNYSYTNKLKKLMGSVHCNVPKKMLGFIMTRNNLLSLDFCFLELQGTEWQGPAGITIKLWFDWTSSRQQLYWLNFWLKKKQTSNMAEAWISHLLFSSELVTAEYKTEESVSPTTELTPIVLSNLMASRSPLASHSRGEVATMNNH